MAGVRLPRTWIYSVVAAAALVVAGEVVARVLTAPLGDRLWAYWAPEAAAKFEWYRQQVATRGAPEVLVVGDSTGAYDFVPAAFSREADGAASYNAAWPANFPLAFEVLTTPLLRETPPPRYVLWLQTAAAFVDTEFGSRMEGAILRSVLGRRQQGKFVLADHLCLARIQLGYELLERYWLEGDRALVRRPAARGFMRKTRIRRRDQVTDTGQGSAHAQFALHGFSTLRRAVVPRCAELSREKGFQLVIVLPPVRDRPIRPVFLAHRDWLMSIQEKEGFAVWDYLDAMQPRDFADDIHLLPRAAARFSAMLGDRFARTR